jgi:voltage-gated potassium channel
MIKSTVSGHSLPSPADSHPHWHPRTWRRTLGSYLETIDTPGGKVITGVITGLILLSSGLFVLQTYELPDPVRVWLARLDNLVLLLFVVEYLLRLWCADRKWQFLYSWYSLIDIVVVLPFLLGAANLGFLRIFRCFRILRLLRFVQGRWMLGKVTSEDGLIISRILFTVFCIIFVYAGLIYQVEHGINAEQFATLLDAVYFAVSSISTAGFGDITPVSQVGRLLTMAMIFTGLCLIPWQLGDLIKRLVKSADQLERPCPRCGLRFHDADAQFCKACGTALPLSPKGA